MTDDGILNAAFFVFHTSWIVFICAGWIWRRTRPWQLAAIGLTALSWVVLAPWYGLGYCPFTDWHWRVRERMGFVDPPSYVQLLVREATGIPLAAAVADALAVAVLIASATLSMTRMRQGRKADARG